MVAGGSLETGVGEGWANPNPPLILDPGDGATGDRSSTPAWTLLNRITPSLDFRIFLRSAQVVCLLTQSQTATSCQKSSRTDER
ncbi:unnamed protein product [Boreogadus saida]